MDIFFRIHIILFNHTITPNGKLKIMPCLIENVTWLISWLPLVNDEAFDIVLTEPREMRESMAWNKLKCRKSMITVSIV